MSSDLLAEFDSFYRTPQNAPTKNKLAPSTTPSTSAFEDLSFLGTTNPTQSNSNRSQLQWHDPVAKPSDDIWGNLGAFDTGSSQYTDAVPATDPWGSFQAPGHSGGARDQPYGSTKTRHDETYTSGTSDPNPRIIRRPTMDLFSSNIVNLAESTPTRPQNEAMSGHKLPWTTSRSLNIKMPPNDNSNVLFDASDELEIDGDDDFGDFETVSTPNPQIDLLQIESPAKAEKVMKKPSEFLTTDKSPKAGPFPYPQAPKSPSFRERNPFADLAVTTPPISNLKEEGAPQTESPVTAWPEYESNFTAAGPYHDSLVVNDRDEKGEDEEEDWGDFEDLVPETKATQSLRTGVEGDGWAWDAVDSQPGPISTRSAEVSPPTNIPPPSVLLAVFPQLFNLPQTRLFQAVANQTFSIKNRILSDPSTVEFLRAYILLATVAARIIAGRKLRWKRDIHLLQAMKIGPAVAHGKGGMKLTGVDKAESAREEREATDVVRIWKDQVGRLRSAVAAANSSLSDPSVHLAVPEITETAAIKTEGALTAPKACVLCGLKREERIPKVDSQVEDSFGEWWAEHWGHRVCRNFWQEHESKLKQR